MQFLSLEKVATTLLLLHKIEGGNPFPQLRILEIFAKGELSLFCSGPKGSHRTKVRGPENETNAAYKPHFVFFCDWPEEKDLERFEISFEDGNGNQLGTMVAEQKKGLLQQYRTVACIRDVWPEERTGLRKLPQWMEFHLQHGVEHFLIYTVNLDSQVLVDLYEPYIKSGVATRVHFNEEVVGATADPESFHGPIHAQLKGDCLYRFKNHATWIFPAIDTDEFINMKDGNLFEGGKVPEDYAGSSWDAIVKKSGLERDRVHSIAFNVYRFAEAEAGQMELSSVRRDPLLQQSCPKYVLNADNVNTVFLHWAGSWKSGTQSLAVLDTDTLVLHHYRRPSGLVGADLGANTTDESMQQYVPDLSRTLARRFGEPAPHFVTRLSAVEPVPFQTSKLVDRETIHENAQKFGGELQAGDPACDAWLSSIRNLKGIVRLDPPSEYRF